jgi:hypothetical protein
MEETAAEKRRAAVVAMFQAGQYGEAAKQFAEELRGAEQRELERLGGCHGGVRESGRSDEWRGMRLGKDSKSMRRCKAILTPCQARRELIPSCGPGCERGLGREEGRLWRVVAGRDCRAFYIVLRYVR